MVHGPLKARVGTFARTVPRDDNSWTELACVTGLWCSWAVGAVACVMGAVFLAMELREQNAVFFVTTQYAREVLPLALNVAVTALNDSMGYIHAVALRWSLVRENELQFSSNVRLFSSSKHHRPNAWYSNAVFLVGILLSYSSTSLIFLGVNPELAKVLGFDFGSDGPAPDRDEIHVNAFAVVTFGVGLLMQAAMTTWTYRTTDIPSWSSDPFGVVRKCLEESDSVTLNRYKHRPGRCMMGVHESGERPRPHKPRDRQRSLYSAPCRQVKVVFYLLVVLPPLAVVWAIAVFARIAQGSPNGVLGRSWSFLPVFTGTSDHGCNAASCTDGSSILGIGWTYSGALGSLGSIFVIMAFQSVLTVALHCAELLVNLSRDEGTHRQLISAGGTDDHYNSVVAACTSWQTITLFGLKSGVHWLFGLSINVSFRLGITMFPVQIFYLSLISASMAGFGAFLAFRRSSGPLPAAFGHVQTIMDLVDVWPKSRRMYWGHLPELGKDGSDRGHPSYAGVSGAHRLELPFLNRWYGGDPGPRDLAEGVSFAVGNARTPSPTPPPSPRKEQSRGRSRSPSPSTRRSADGFGKNGRHGAHDVADDPDAVPLLSAGAPPGRSTPSPLALPRPPYLSPNHSPRGSPSPSPMPSPGLSTGGSGWLTATEQRRIGVKDGGPRSLRPEEAAQRPRGRSYGRSGGASSGEYVSVPRHSTDGRDTSHYPDGW